MQDLKEELFQEIFKIVEKADREARLDFLEAGVETPPLDFKRVAEFQSLIYFVLKTNPALHGQDDVVDTILNSVRSLFSQTEELTYKLVQEFKKANQ